MKKSLLLIGIIVLSINWSTMAQTEYGLKTGLNVSKFSGTLIGAEYKQKIGFYAGGYANFGISEKFKVQPEILFALQGSNFVIENMEIRDDPNDIPKVGDFKTKTTETTISIPIVAQYFVADGFYLEAGPQIGLILNRKEVIIESPTDDPNFNGPADFNNDTFDLGLAVGAGYELSDKLTLNFRYFFGLIERDLFNVKSSVLNLGIEYKL